MPPLSTLEKDILFAEDFQDLKSGAIGDYCTHALCLEGEARFKLAGKNFLIRKNDCIIFTHSELVSDISMDQDFRACVLYIANHFLMNNLPKNDYDVVGKLTLLRNPVMKLTGKECGTFLDDARHIRQRLADTEHHFHSELMGCLVETFVLDLYDFHVRLYDFSSISEQNAALMNRFIERLKAKEYERHREVSYYASKLCVSPKYLSEVCKKTSGFTANFWIDRFTITGITRMLSDKKMTIKEISDKMNFSSLSFFSRYVQRILKVSPSAYRNQNALELPGNQQEPAK